MKSGQLMRWVRNYRLARIFVWQQLTVAALFLVPLFSISGVVYRLSRDIVEDGVEESILSALSRFADAFDREVASTVVTSMQLLGDRDVCAIASVDPVNRNWEFIRRVQRLQRQLGTFLTTSRLIQDLYLYFPAQNYLLKSSSGSVVYDAGDPSWYLAVEDLLTGAPAPMWSTPTTTSVRAGGSSEHLLVVTQRANLADGGENTLALGVVRKARVVSLLEETTGWSEAAVTIRSDDTTVLGAHLGAPNGIELLTHTDPQPLRSDFRRFGSTEPVQYFTGGLASSRPGLEYRVAVPLVWYQERFRVLDRILAAMLVFSALLTVVLSLLVSVSLFRPMKRVLKVINQPPRGLDLPNASAGQILDEMARRAPHGEDGSVEESLRRRFDLFKSAQAIALQSQIRPHFLSNTLETVNWAVMRMTGGPNEASQMLSLFSRTLRVGLRQDAYVVPLSEELEHVGYFMELQNRRFAGRLVFLRETDGAAESCTLPKLTLHPIVENAVQHGVRPREHSGRIVVSAHVVHDVLVVEVSDDGVGMSRSALQSVRRSLNDDAYLSGRHVGLANVHQRLIILYGDDYGLSIDSSPTSGTRVTVRLPALPAHS